MVSGPLLKLYNCWCSRGERKGEMGGKEVEEEELRYGSVHELGSIMGRVRLPHRTKLWCQGGRRWDAESFGETKLDEEETEKSRQRKMGCTGENEVRAMWECRGGGY